MLLIVCLLLLVVCCAVVLCVVVWLWLLLSVVAVVVDSAVVLLLIVCLVYVVCCWFTSVQTTFLKACQWIPGVEPANCLLKSPPFQLCESAAACKRRASCFARTLAAIAWRLDMELPWCSSSARLGCEGGLWSEAVAWLLLPAAPPVDSWLASILELLPCRFPSRRIPDLLGLGAVRPCLHRVVWGLPPGKPCQCGFACPGGRLALLS